MVSKDTKIEQLFNSNAQLSQKIESSFPVIAKSLEKTKFKYTNKALLSFISKSGYLTSAILELSLNRNVYPVTILFRSMIEHNFRHMYIYVRALNDDTDDVGKRYYKTLKASEDLESFTKVNNYSKIVYPEKTEWSIKGEHNKMIRDVGKEFRIEQIFYYLIANNNKDSNKTMERFKKEYLLGRLINYTNLSSGVHGGPFGELALFSHLQKNEIELSSDLYKFACDSFELHYSAVKTTYLFACLMDSEMKKYYEEIKTIAHEFNRK